MSSARVICPHCKAKLRISTDGGVPTRAKCSTCRHTFTPTFTGAVGGAALYMDASTSAAPLAPFSFPPPGPDSEPAAAPASAPAMRASPQPSAVAVAAPPATSAGIEDRPERPRQAPEPATVVQPAAAQLPFSEPPPAVADSTTRSRHRESHDPFQKRLQPYEIVLATGLVLAGLAGLGMLWYYHRDPPKGDGPAGTTAEDTFVPNLAAVPSEKDLMPTEKDLVPKPRPAQLAGIWELRSDDGRSGRLILSPDGRLAASSTAGDSPLPDYEGHWFLYEETGDRYVLEFGREHRGLDGYKVTVLLTSPDALTLVKTIKNGVPTWDQHRFIRIGPAPVAKAKGP